MLLVTRGLGFLQKSRQMPGCFPLWLAISRKSCQNGPMIAADSILRKNPLVLLLGSLDFCENTVKCPVNCASGYKGRNSRQMAPMFSTLTCIFTLKPVSRTSGYKGLWIFAKILSNALMYFALTRNFTENPLVLLLVTRVLGFLRKSRQMPRCLLTRNFME